MKNNLKELRWKKGWSQAELSRRSRVAKSTICEIENERTIHPTIDVVRKLHLALKVDVWELFEDD